MQGRPASFEVWCTRRSAEMCQKACRCGPRAGGAAVHAGSMATRSWRDCFTDNAAVWHTRQQCHRSYCRMWRERLGKPQSMLPRGRPDPKSDTCRMMLSAPGDMLLRRKQQGRRILHAARQRTPLPAKQQRWQPPGGGRTPTEKRTMRCSPTTMIGSARW